MSCVMFVICQSKFEHLKMRKQDIYWQCHWFSHLQILKFLLTNHKHHTRHLFAMPLVFSSSNPQIFIDKSHKTFIGNAIVLCDVCDLSIKI
jgi:hypothetical protein